MQTVMTRTWSLRPPRCRSYRRFAGARGRHGSWWERAPPARPYLGRAGGCRFSGRLRRRRQRRYRWHGRPGRLWPGRSAGGARVGVGGGVLDVAQWHARVQAGVMNACRSVCGPASLPVPARRAAWRTIRPVLRRSRRRPSGRSNSGPSHRSPAARSIALGGPRASVTGQAPLTPE
jgi:hypothetical protein